MWGQAQRDASAECLENTLTQESHLPAPASGRPENRSAAPGMAGEPGSGIGLVTGLCPPAYHLRAASWCWPYAGHCPSVVDKEGVVDGELGLLGSKSGAGGRAGV